MIEFVLAMPWLVGAGVTMTLATACGLLVYGLAYRFISYFKRYELKDSIVSLFRMVGILVSLMLSLGFNEVMAEWKAIRNAIDREAVAISDVYVAMHLYDAEEAREVQKVVIDYIQAIVDDDWPAMAQNRLGQRASVLRIRISKMVSRLVPTNTFQKELKASIISDLDAISDFRMIRLNHTLSKRPVYVFVIIFGFLVSMACFGAYRPQVPLIALVSLYTAFIGLVLYLVISLSDPFHGGYTIDPIPFERLIETLRSAG